MSTFTRSLVLVLAGAALLVATAVPSEATTAAAAPESAASSARQRADHFTVATFNVRGASHRATRPWTSRMRGSLRAIARHGVSLVGLQELERAQYLAFRHATAGRWSVVGTLSRNGRSLDSRNAIAYRSSRFRLVARSSLTIPYLHGTPVAMPVITLRSRATGQAFVVINTHNPADVRGNAQRYRTIAMLRQVALVNRLRARGSTVLVTGDMNDRSSYFCAMTRNHRMHAASGGSIGRRCRPPRPSGIDWIFASRDVSFRRYVSDQGTRRAGYSDHPIVVAAVSLRR